MDSTGYLLEMAGYHTGYPNEMAGYPVFNAGYPTVFRIFKNRPDTPDIGYLPDIRSIPTFL